MGPRVDGPESPRRRVSRTDALRKARQVPAHACGPDCFICLVAQYAKTVRLQQPVYAPKGKPHGTKQP